MNYAVAAIGMLVFLGLGIYIGRRSYPAMGEVWVDQLTGDPVQIISVLVSFSTSEARSLQFNYSKFIEEFRKGN